MKTFKERTLSRLEQEIGLLKMTVVSLRDDNMFLENQRKGLKEEVAKLQEYNENLEEVNERLFGNLDELEESNAKLRTCIKGLKEENASLKDFIAKLQTKIFKLENPEIVKLAVKKHKHKWQTAGRFEKNGKWFMRLLCSECGEVSKVFDVEQ